MTVFIQKICNIYHIYRRMYKTYVYIKSNYKAIEYFKL